MDRFFIGWLLLDFTLVDLYILFVFAHYHADPQSQLSTISTCRPMLGWFPHS